MLISSVAHAKWTKVTEDKNGTTFYVDLERIRKHDGKVYYWYLADLLKPEKNGTISFRLYTEAECGRFRYRWLSVTFYKDPMASGRINSSRNTPESEWSYPSPDSMAESTLKAVCNHKP